MPLLNYTSKVPVSKTVSEVMQMLVKKGASHIMTEYDGNAQLAGLKWRIDTQHGPLSYSMPVNCQSVLQIMTRQRILPRDPDRRWEQAQRTAWRILKDWIEAQMALLETGMAQMEEVFLPYMLTGDQTLYKTLAEGGFKALPSGDHV